MEKRDIKGGDFTWGERIQLGKILADKDAPEMTKALNIIECLHGKDHPPIYTLADYIEEIAEGLAFWVQQEQTLYLEHSAEEMEAGYKQFSEAVGEMASIINVAKCYGKCPDEVLEWKYPTVFMHLKVEVESEKFNRRLQKVYEKKQKYASKKR